MQFLTNKNFSEMYGTIDKQQFMKKLDAFYNLL